MKSLMRGTALFGALALVVAFTGRTRASQPNGPTVNTNVTDANITRLTTEILARSQFAHHPLDAELAAKLLDRYVDALDGTRSVFLQSDVDGFATYRQTLAQATLGKGDTTAAHAIFARYLQRLEQQVAYFADTLRNASFDFSGHDVYSFDREHARRPPDVLAAKAVWRQQLRAEYLEEKLSDKRPDQIVATLMRRHEQQLRTTKGLRDDELLEVYLDTLAHVYDPHSDYLGHEGMESLSIAMNLSLFGIGASLETADGYCQIRNLLPGGPAAQSGLLKPKDRILAVGQAGKEPVDIVNMPLSRAVELIRGPKGSVVTLTVTSGGDVGTTLPKIVPLVRDEIKLADQEAKARIVDLPMVNARTLRLGVIELPSFYADIGRGSPGGHRSATEDVARLVKKLKAESVRGIVMDLRNNGGGSLEEAITLTGLFIRSGPVVQTRDPGGKIEVGTDDDGNVLYDGPLVLLTSRFSASATEIMAGALQDYGRAVVVGDTATFGKGTVQNILGLAPLMDRAGLAHAYDPGALKVTISKFYRPSGVSTQLRGVASDIALPSTTDFSDFTESSLKDPLPWDVVPPTAFGPVNRVQPYLAALRERSSQRVKGERAFAYLETDVQRLRKSLASKVVSLNEVERRQEMAQDKARRTQRERESRDLEASDAPAYAITLENVDAPGLPPPLARSKTNAASREAGASVDQKVDSIGDRDAILHESEEILADYVALLRPTPDTSALHRAARR
jgi:carboxyl-terminal processing protease